MTEEDFKALAERRHVAITELTRISRDHLLAKARVAELNCQYHDAIAARVASSQQKACEK